MTGIEEFFGLSAAAASTAAAGTSAAATAASAVGTAAAASTAAAAGISTGEAAFLSAAGVGATTTATAAPTLAGILTSAAPFISAGSGLLSAVGSVSAGNAQAAALQRNAQVGQINAGASLATSEADAQRLQIRSERAVATGENQSGSSGVDLSTGSPLDVMADAAAQGALDSEISRWRGQTQANAYLTGAQNTAAQASQVQAAGAIQGATTLLTSGARYAAGRLPSQMGYY